MSRIHLLSSIFGKYLEIFINIKTTKSEIFNSKSLKYRVEPKQTVMWTAARRFTYATIIKQDAGQLTASYWFALDSGNFKLNRDHSQPRERTKKSPHSWAVAKLGAGRRSVEDASVSKAIVVLTLFFFSSANTGLCCRGDGVDASASRQISGSADRTSKMTDGSRGFFGGFWWHCESAASSFFEWSVSFSPCDLSIWYAWLIFAWSGRDTVQLYSIAITLAFTLSDIASPRCLKTDAQTSQNGTRRGERVASTDSYILWLKWP